MRHDRQKKPSKKKNPSAKEKSAKQAKAAVNEKKPAVKPRQTNDFPVVGLGVSAGGLVMVQDPASTKYDGMPRSAIATTERDITECR